MVDKIDLSGTGPLILAIDQGTSSTKAILVDEHGSIVSSAVFGLRQAHPEPGWVEQDANEILESVKRALTTVAGHASDRITAIGISSQRESAVAWNAVSGEPVGPVIGWQDRRTIGIAADLSAAGYGPYIRSVSGLPLDPMFSAVKFKWLLDRVDFDRSRSQSGEILLGTVDSWLVFKLTGEHRIEAGHASRTQLLDISTVDWDEKLLRIFNIPRAALPRVATSDERTREIAGVDGLPEGLAVNAILGDSHAALFAHGVRTPGSVKVTYGTGSSIMGVLAADAAVDDGLVKTIAWHVGKAVLAFEGNILSTGATIQWLAQVFDTDPNSVDRLAQSVPSSGGVNIVPAFAGLGAPWWDDQAQGAILGLNLGTTAAHIARAGFESVTLQIEDVLEAADRGSAEAITRVLADGGPSRNDWLMQLQADLSQRQVERSEVAELSAIGVAHLAGLSTGMWSADDVLALPRKRTVFTPQCDSLVSWPRRAEWLSSVATARYRPPLDGDIRDRQPLSENKTAAPNHP